jgi:quercetin dioxygenase-like cupin family protein
MDSNVVPGAFQMNTAWYCAVPERDPIFTEHSHPYSELIGFYGSDPNDMYNLNGEIIFSIDGEAHRLTKSTLIFLPGGVIHNPMRIMLVSKPIFHFSVVMNPDYDGEEVYK